MVCLKTATV
jgi:hypothetical protein